MMSVEDRAPQEVSSAWRSWRLHEPVTSFTTPESDDKASFTLATSRSSARNAALLFAIAGFAVSALGQACSPGVLENSNDYAAEVSQIRGVKGAGGGPAAMGGGSSGGSGPTEMGGGGNASGGQTGGSGGGVSTPKSDADFYPLAPCDIPAILASSTDGCTGACHNAVPNNPLAGGLDLVTAPLWNRLLDVDAKHTAATTTCPQRAAKLISSANPAMSWMLVKLTDAGATCGLKMPLIGALTPASKQCLTDWINNIATQGTL